jgi:hypothetical protein
MGWLFNRAVKETEAAIEEALRGTNVTSGCVGIDENGNSYVDIWTIDDVPQLPDGREISIIDLIAERGGQIHDE